jgi:hypothetical protein
MVMSHKPTIVAIVEGPGDEGAVRDLLNRWFHHQKVFTVQLKFLVTKGVTKLLATYDAEGQHGVEYWIDKAQAHRPCAILVLLDADEECIENPKPGPTSKRKFKPPGRQLGPWLLSRARTIASHIPISVVVADRCFESWFFCAPCQEALLAAELFERTDHAAAGSARGRWESRLSALLGRPYSKTTDQPRLAQHLPIGEHITTENRPGDLAWRSFQKLQRELTNLHAAVAAWRPPDIT